MWSRFYQPLKNFRPEASFPWRCWSCRGRGFRSRWTRCCCLCAGGSRPASSRSAGHSAETGRWPACGRIWIFKSIKKNTFCQYSNISTNYAFYVIKNDFNKERPKNLTPGLNVLLIDHRGTKFESVKRYNNPLDQVARSEGPVSDLNAEAETSLVTVGSVNGL
jgi:hypothetical protein